MSQRGRQAPRAARSVCSCSCARCYRPQDTDTKIYWVLVGAHRPRGAGCVRRCVREARSRSSTSAFRLPPSESSRRATRGVAVRGSMLCMARREPAAAYSMHGRAQTQVFMRDCRYFSDLFLSFLTIATHGPCWGLHTRETRSAVSHNGLCVRILSLSLSLSLALPTTQTE